MLLISVCSGRGHRGEREEDGEGRGGREARGALGGGARVYWGSAPVLCALSCPTYGRCHSGQAALVDITAAFLA